MPIKVLIADDSETMRSAIVRVLKDNSDYEVIGEAASFAQTLELTAALKPDVLLLDLLMPDESDFPPEEIKQHLLHNAGCILAISIWNDPEARTRADSLGTKLLLDKAQLFSELTRSIKLFGDSK
jgi:DNA-binding NarL/FixJ family response regulator